MNLSHLTLLSSMKGILLKGILVLATLVLTACGEGVSGGDGSGGAVQGQRGSTARMALIDDFLYTISGDTLQLFNVADGTNPEPWTVVQLDFGIETLFPFGNLLLVGADAGVFILDNTDRAAPVLIGEFIHATAEDPVVARDNLAYVTLARAPNQRPTDTTDIMDIIDITDPTNPIVVHTISMESPKGLTIDGERLHVCDGEGGIKTFSLANPEQPSLMFTLPNERCTDMLMVNDILLTVGVDGVSQFDVTMGRPQKISEITRETVIYLLDP